MIRRRKALLFALAALLDVSFAVFKQCETPRQGHFNCQGLGCSSNKLICDGKKDCGNEGEDEADEICKITCQAGWQAFRGKCYWNPGYYVRSMKVAQLKCSTIEGGAVLALPTDEVFADFLSLLTPPKQPKFIWINAMKKDMKGQHIWVDKDNLTLTYHPWKTQVQPNSPWEKVYNCAVFKDKDNSWIHSFCQRRYGITFVCEGNVDSRRPEIRRRSDYASGAVKPSMTSSVTWVLATLSVVRFAWQ